VIYTETMLQQTGSTQKSTIILGFSSKFAVADSKRYPCRACDNNISQIEEICNEINNAIQDVLHAYAKAQLMSGTAFSVCFMNAMVPAEWADILKILCYVPSIVLYTAFAFLSYILFCVGLSVAWILNSLCGLTFPEKRHEVHSLNSLIRDLDKIAGKVTNENLFLRRNDLGIIVSVYKLVPDPAQQGWKKIGRNDELPEVPRDCHARISLHLVQKSSFLSSTKPSSNQVEMKKLLSDERMLGAADANEEGVVVQMKL